MNKIGILDIIKAYLGTKELSANNAYIGEIPLINTPIIDDRLRFEALADNTVIGLAQKSTVYNILQYSLDGDNWNDLTTSTSITLNTGDEMFIRGHMNANGGNNNYNNFKVTSGAAAIKGNIMYLYDYLQPELKTISYTYAFRRLFYECEYLDASELMLPSTTLASYCYSGMFSKCSIEVAPKLPATTLANSCYFYMFEQSNIITAPELPATTLANYCYAGMFNGCSDLTTAPELPVTTLANNCYLYMFLNCTSLTEAPELPATTLANMCYLYMFNGCSSLTSAPELPATTLITLCYSYMFLNCTSLTEAPELSATTLANMCYLYMFNGCSSLTSAPELPATTLKSNCYREMFSACISLRKIIIYAQDISATNCLTGWTAGVSSTGDFYNLGGATYPSGDNGIPSGWTVHTSL